MKEPGQTKKCLKIRKIVFLGRITVFSLIIPHGDAFFDHLPGWGIIRDWGVIRDWGIIRENTVCVKHSQSLYILMLA
jgi:hypothetical protein